jgi:hypothetical protein
MTRGRKREWTKVWRLGKERQWEEKRNTDEKKIRKNLLWVCITAVYGFTPWFSPINPVKKSEVKAAGQDIVKCWIVNSKFFYWF